MSIELIMPFNRLIPCCPLLLLPSIFPSIRVFSNESVFAIRWPKFWDFSFSISPSNEYSGLISFRIYWFDLLVVHGILKSLQQHIAKASILWHSASFMVQLSHPYMTTGKPKLWLYWPLSAKWCLCFLKCYPSCHSFPSRSKHLLISWLQLPSAVIMEPKKIKSVTVSIFFPFYLPWSEGTGC